jgi:hypothetical protein
MPDEQEGGVDRVRSIVEALGQGGLAELLQAGEVPRPGLTVRAGGGWTLIVAAFPTPATEQLPDPNSCEKDCLALLAASAQPLAAARARKELERRDFGIYSLITVKRALANLHLRRKLIANSRRRPRGYFLPNVLPLLRSAGSRQDTEL